jgi:hypothetical protein
MLYYAIVCACENKYFEPYLQYALRLLTHSFHDENVAVGAVRCQ